MEARPPRQGLKAAAGIAVVLLLTGAIATAVRRVEQVVTAAPLVARWTDYRAQRAIVEGAERSALADHARVLIPRDSGVVLITPGTDPRRTEYVNYQRLLYHLPLRQVWWVNSAPRDGTWESRFWTPMAADGHQLRAFAMTKGARFLLFDGVAAPADLPAGLPLTGQATLILLDGGRLDAATAGTPPASPVRVIVSAVIAALAMLVAGATLLQACGYRSRSRAEWFGHSWIAGTAVVTAAMFWLMLAGVAIGTATHALSAIAATGFVTVLVRRGVNRRAPADAANAAASNLPAVRYRGEQPLTIAAWVAIGFAVIYVALLSIGRPLVVWDSWAVWSMKTRALFEAGNVAAVLEEPSRVTTRADYPLHVPLTQLWFLAWALPGRDGFDDRLAGVPSTLYFAALLTVFYRAARREDVPHLVALCATALLASVGYLTEFSAAVYADVPLAASALVAVVSSLRWVVHTEAMHLPIAAVAGGVLPWTKREGLVLLAALAISLLVVRRERRVLVLIAWWTGSALVFVGGWQVLLAQAGIRSDVFGPITLAALLDGTARVPRIVWLAARSLTAIEWSFFWIAWAFPILGAARRGHTRPHDVLLLATVTYLAVMSGAYVFSNYVPYGQHVVSSFPRLALHVLPAAFLWGLLEVRCVLSKAPAGAVRGL